MGFLLALSRAIDALNGLIGRLVKWLILAAVLVSATNAVVRKVFDTSSNAWLELQWYLFGAVFMLAAAYTLQRNEHIRIDVLSSRFSKRTRDWIDLVCHVLILVPFTAIMIWLCLPFALDSYRSGEVSMNAGGLIVWPAKALILAGFILLFAQAVSEIVKRCAVLTGTIPEPSPGHPLPPIVEEQMTGLEGGPHA